MAPKKPVTALVKWDEELAKQAELAAGMEANVGGGQFFGLRGGILTWQDAPVPNNQMAVVILDSVLENVYYEGEYDADNPASPSCFAFGRDEKLMMPHPLVQEAKTSPAPAGQPCTACPMNEWGSAEKGRGKACRNTRRLAMIPAGTFNQAGKLELFDDASYFASTAMGFMKLPVTSVKGYANFVKQVAGALRRPPFGIFTKIKVLQDPKTQFKVIFEPIDNVPDTLMGTIMQRHEEAKTLIEFPYQLGEEDSGPRQVKSAKPSRAKRKY